MASDAQKRADFVSYTAFLDRLLSCRFPEPVGPGVGAKIAVELIMARQGAVAAIGCAAVFSAGRASTRKAPNRRRIRRQISLLSLFGGRTGNFNSLIGQIMSLIGRVGNFSGAA